MTDEILAPNHAAISLLRRGHPDGTVVVTVYGAGGGVLCEGRVSAKQAIAFGSALVRAGLAGWPVDSRYN